MGDVIATLQPVCSRDGSRKNLGTPFGMTLDGRLWACATDGHVMAALPMAGEIRKDGPDAARLCDIAATHKTTVEALRAWAGPSQPLESKCPECGGVPVKCQECKGEGEIAAPYCDCPSCDGYHPCHSCRGKRRCKTCQDSGEVTAPVRYGRIGPAILNLNLLALALDTAPPSGEVAVGTGGEKDPVLFRTTDWISVVMPMMHASGKPSVFDGATAITPEQRS